MKHIFLQGKGKYRISWCWVTAREELQIWCCSFLPPPQLMQFSGFPLRCRLCPTFGHSTDCGDTPKYINSHTRSETHWFVPKYPVKKIDSTNQAQRIMSISCHLKNIFMIWGPFMRKVMADWHQMCHKLSARRCQAKQSSKNIQSRQIYWSLQIQILLFCVSLFPNYCDILEYF